MSLKSDDGDSPTRPLKRIKTTSPLPQTSQELDLPAECWAQVCHFLPYSDVKNVAATCSTFMHQVMPTVSRLYVFHPKELHARHARRFPHVERVYIYCLLQKPADQRRSRTALFGPFGRDWELEYCTETKYRVVPYLCYLNKLRYVFLGAMCYIIEPQRQEPRVGDAAMPPFPFNSRSRLVWNGRTNVTSPTKQTRLSNADIGSQSHKTLVHSFCGAFATGSLSKRFRIDGLFHARAVCLCPNVMIVPHMREPRPECAQCSHVLQHFPSDWLAHARGGFLCTPPKVRLQHIVNRGHSKLLKDEKMLKRLIEDGLRDVSTLQRTASSSVRPIGLANAHLMDLQALKELGMVDPAQISAKLVMQRLRKIQKISRTPIQFSRKSLTELQALGVQIQSEMLEEVEIGLLDDDRPEAQQQPRWSANGPFRHPWLGWVPPPHDDHDGEGEIGEGIEINIEDGGEVNEALEPLYQDIFNRVRDVVRQQLGDDQAEHFGNLHDQMMGDAAANQGVEGGGIIVRGIIGGGPMAAGGPRLVFGQPPPPELLRDLMMGRFAPPPHVNDDDP